MSERKQLLANGKCPACDGTGVDDVDGDIPLKCVTCDGTGYIRTEEDEPPTCKRCGAVMLTRSGYCCPPVNEEINQRLVIEPCVNSDEHDLMTTDLSVLVCRLESKAWAEFILKAVNSHDSLVEALKKIEPKAKVLLAMAKATNTKYDQTQLSEIVELCETAGEEV